MKSTKTLKTRFVGGLLALAAVVTAGTLFTQQPASAWNYQDRMVHDQMMMNGTGFGYSPYYNAGYGAGYGYSAPAAVNPYWYQQHYHHHHHGW